MDQLGLYVSVWVSQAILSEKCKLHNIFISTSYRKYPLPGFIYLCFMPFNTNVILYYNRSWKSTLSQFWLGLPKTENKVCICAC